MAEIIAAWVEGGKAFGSVQSDTGKLDENNNPIRHEEIISIDVPEGAPDEAILAALAQAVAPAKPLPPARRDIKIDKPVPVPDTLDAQAAPLPG